MQLTDGHSERWFFNPQHSLSIHGICNKFLEEADENLLGPQGVGFQTTQELRYDDHHQPLSHQAALLGPTWPAIEEDQGEKM